MVHFDTAWYLATYADAAAALANGTAGSAYAYFLTVGIDKGEQPNASQHLTRADLPFSILNNDPLALGNSALMTQPLSNYAGDGLSAAERAVATAMGALHSGSALAVDSALSAIANRKATDLVANFSNAIKSALSHSDSGWAGDWSNGNGLTQQFREALEAALGSGVPDTRFKVFVVASSSSSAASVLLQLQSQSGFAAAIGNAAMSTLGIAEYGGLWLVIVANPAAGYPVVEPGADGLAAITEYGGGDGDILYAGSRAAHLYGLDGDDRLFGSSGNDLFDGGNGSDTVDYSDDSAGVSARLNTGSASGATIGSDTFASIENLTGGSGSDTLVGDSERNFLSGGGGNDIVDGGGGADNLYGGAGDDTFYVDRADDLVFENAGEGNDSVTTTAGYYLYANIERLNLAAGAGDIFGVGNELANLIYGNEGANLIIAGAGNDLVWGGAGGDSLFGEDGADQLVGDAGIDYLVGGLGNDSLYGEAGADALYGQEGDDTLFGGDDFATDIMVGGDGNDLFYGASGLGDYDLMDGGAGDDRYVVDTPADLTFEAPGGGNDTVYADIIGAGYYLYANVENLTLQGTTPFGVGNELNNYLTGNASANYLLGGAGNDALNGKGGNDVLFGEGGADTFVFERGTGGDVIGDFLAGTDKIDLSTLGLSWQTVVNSMHEVNGTTAIDLGSGDFIVLNGVASAALHAGDFILAGASAAEEPFGGRISDAPAYEDNSGFGFDPEFDIPLHLLKPDGGPALDFLM